MYIYNKKILAVLLLVIIVAIMIVFPAGAFAADMAPGAIAEKTTIKQEFTYKKGETPNIQQEIIQFGQVFTLVSVSEPAEDKTLPATRSYTYQVSSNYTPEQLSQAPKNVKLTPIYGAGKRQVDRIETVVDLPDNDVDRLPQRKMFFDTNGRGPGAALRGMLVLAEVEYVPSGWDEDGLPDNYTAHVYYRGEENYTALLCYEAVTTYTKTVTEDGDTMYTVVATYEGDAPAAAEPGEPASGGAEDSAPVSPEVTFPFSLGGLSALGTAAIVTMAAALISLAFIGIYNRYRLRESTQAN